MLETIIAQPKQEKFLEAIFDAKYEYLLYGGAVRSAKTHTALIWLTLMCYLYPSSRWFVIRKNMPSLKKNFIRDFEVWSERVVPGFFHPINKQDWTVRAINGSEIIFLNENYDQDKDLQWANGLAVSGGVCEEANELQQVTFNKLSVRIGTWNCPDLPRHRQPPRKMMLTCNPANNWVKTMFYVPHTQGKLNAPFYFLQASPYDNKHNPPGLLESYELQKETNPAYYERFIRGNWNFAEDDDQLIKYEWLYTAQSVEPRPGVMSLGVDVATSLAAAADNASFLLRNGNAAIDNRIYKGLRSTQLANKIRDNYILTKGIDPANIIIDTIGNGEGVYSSLYDQGYTTTSFVAGARPLDLTQIDRDTLLLPEFADSEYLSGLEFLNKRAQAWYYMRECFRKEKVAFAIEDPEMLQRLINDLAAPKYIITNERKIKAEAKEDVKKRLGRSTDQGDSFIQSFFPVEPADTFIYR